MQINEEGKRYTKSFIFLFLLSYLLMQIYRLIPEGGKLNVITYFFCVVFLFLMTLLQLPMAIFCSISGLGKYIHEGGWTFLDIDILYVFLGIIWYAILGYIYGYLKSKFPKVSLRRRHL